MTWVKQKAARMYAGKILRIMAGGKGNGCRCIPEGKNMPVKTRENKKAANCAANEFLKAYPEMSTSRGPNSLEVML